MNSYEKINCKEKINFLCNVFFSKKLFKNLSNVHVYKVYIHRIYEMNIHRIYELIHISLTKIY